MHLDDERVQRLLHGELEPGADRRAREHLAGCESCRLLMAEAREEEGRIFGLLGRVDHQAPEVDPELLISAAVRVRPRRERWVAGFALAAAAAGAAYAAPGSPLPRVLQRVFGFAATSSSPVAASPEAGEAAPPGAGIAVTPGDRLTIRFLIRGEGAVATLSVTEGIEVSVRAVDGAATFTSDEDRISVHGAGPARFEILIPRTAPSVDVVSDKVPVLRKRGADIVTGAVPEADGRYRLMLPPSR